MPPLSSNVPPLSSKKNKKKKKVFPVAHIPIFCSRVKERRKALGMTLQSLGDKVVFPRQGVARLESGLFPRDEWRIVALAKALDVSLDWLFGREG